MGDGGVLVWLTAVVIALAPQHHASPALRSPLTPRVYARRLTLDRWHSIGEWYALDAIVRPESGWNPCSVYPSQHVCSYRGSNSCGIPQANPCPWRWRGHLFPTRWAQVRWLIGYVSRRYGDPFAALAFRHVHGSY